MACALSLGDSANVFESSGGSGFSAKRKRRVVEDDLEHTAVAKLIDRAQDLVAPHEGV